MGSSGLWQAGSPRTSTARQWSPRWPIPRPACCVARAAAPPGSTWPRHSSSARTCCSGAAGFDIEAARWPEFSDRFLSLAAGRAVPSGPPTLAVDLVLPGDGVDYALIREIALLAPNGAGNPLPMIAITGLRIVRVRAAKGGHTQLVVGRSRDVLDAVAFRRSDLPAMLREGDRVDVVALASSRKFGGFESIQLQVIDVAAEGTQAAVKKS